MKGNFHVVLDACVLDACVLANYTRCDLLLKLAEPPRLHTPHWTHQILDETHRALTQKFKRPWPVEKADYFRIQILQHFPEALVSGQEVLEPSCLNHEKDQHVLAAAIRANAQAVVTFNLKDFPPEAMAPWNIDATHPADYLIALYSIDSGVVLSKLNEMALKRKITPQELLAKMSRQLEPFTTHVAEALGWTLPPQAG